MSEGLRFRRESAPFNLYIDMADAIDDGKGNKSWMLNLPKNLGPEDFIGAIMTIKEQFADIKVTFNAIMIPSVGSAIAAMSSFDTDNGVMKLKFVYTDGQAAVSLTTAS